MTLETCDGTRADPHEEIAFTCSRCPLCNAIDRISEVENERDELECERDGLRDKLDRERDENEALRRRLGGGL